jgi:hypothetical protein
MGEVVSLPRRDGGSTVWVCNCGSTTHYHHADGKVTCGSCEQEAGAANGEWRLRFPEAPSEPAPLDSANFKIAAFNTAEVFFRRQAKAASGRPIAAALVFFADGSFSNWCGGIEAEDQRAWLRDRLREAETRLVPVTD